VDKAAVKVAEAPAEPVAEVAVWPITHGWPNAVLR